MSSGAVFMVEDDADLRESLKDLLEFEGYSVEWASDGVDALAKLRANPIKPKLILLDWMMPKMDGAEFCMAKNQIPELAAIPVVLLTADGRVSEKAKQVGATTGIAKPVEIELLLLTVGQFFSAGA
jgi:two-component system, chemotaxis family, chemotaxis protein CheY